MAKSRCGHPLSPWSPVDRWGRTRCCQQSWCECHDKNCCSQVDYIGRWLDAPKGTRAATLRDIPLGHCKTCQCTRTQRLVWESYDLPQNEARILALLSRYTAPEHGLDFKSLHDWINGDHDQSDKLYLTAKETRQALRALMKHRPVLVLVLYNPRHDEYRRVS